MLEILASSTSNFVVTLIHFVCVNASLTFRQLDANQLTGSVQALGKLTKLTRLYVDAGL